ncbi:FIG00469468: hypothetical protein [hydrothermal vent metagenome]|uniref:Stringent starvation protein B n=1 Tax=hydrothermal vent metagenome TaxID=652676 RepID=A0A1W1CHM3_9ZZZZ
MTINLFQTPEYKELIQNHIFQTIEYLFQKNQEFAVACDTQYITFNPELPQSILDSFNETVLFVLGGYTFESATLDKEYFTFEAGFGSENYGSVVTVPLLCIKQIFVGDNPIVFNLAKYEVKREKHTTSTKSSMEALLNNPENQKLLKKKNRN